MSLMLYDKQLTLLAANLPLLPRLATPDATATKKAAFCGSTITIDLRLKNGKVTAYGHDVKTCLLGKAAASIMARHILESAPEELRHMRTIAKALLKDESMPEIPSKWKEIEALRAIKPYPLRHASTLLVFDAVHDALEALDEGKTRK